MRNVVAIAVGIVLVPMLLAAQPKSEGQKVVDIVAKGLRSRDAAERVRAAEQLGSLKRPEAVDPLVKALADPDARVREEAASALWDASEVSAAAIPALRTALADPAPAVAIRAAGALIAMDVPPAELTNTLRLVLETGGEAERFLAARALIGIDPADRLATPLLDYLVRSTAGGANPNRDNYTSGTRALARLTKTQDASAIEPLMNRLREPALTQPVLAALGELETPPPGWNEALLGSLASPIPEARETAIELLAKRDGGDEIRAWVGPVGARLADPEERVRAEAVRALEKARALAIGQIDPLLALLQKESNEDLRESAVEALGVIADATNPAETATKVDAARKSLPVLLALIERDPDMDVREAAIRALDRLHLDSTTAAEHLGRIAAQQTARDVRNEALLRLTRRGTDAAPAEASIAHLTKDADALTRQFAQEALDGMRGETGAKKVVTTSGAAPASRDRALETLRTAGVAMTEEAYLVALMQVKQDQVEAFLDAGMSPNHRFASSMGQHALHVVAGSPFACPHGTRPTPEESKSLVKMLLARGADPNLADDHGNTPLLASAMSCDAPLVKMLIAAKANIQATNSAGMTAFEMSVFGLQDATAALLDAGFRLSPEKVKVYLEAWKDDPKKLALVKRAAK